MRARAGDESQESALDAVLGVLSILVVVLAWPVGALFLVCLAGWDWARRRGKWWTETAASLLLPVALGFGAATLLLLVLRVFDPQSLAHYPSFAENVLVRSRIWVHRVNSPGVVTLVVIILIAYALNHLFPRLRPSRRVAAFWKAASTLWLVLAAMTTFTVLSDKPLDRWAEGDRQASENRLQVAFRKQYDSVGQYLMVERLKPAVQNLSNSDKRHFIALANGIDHILDLDSLPNPEGLLIDSPTTPAITVPFRVRFRDGDITRPLARAVGRSYASKALNQPDVREFLADMFPTLERAGLNPPTSEKEKAVKYVATTVEEWKRQRALVEEQESTAVAAQLKAEDDKVALDTLAVGVLGLVGPELPGICGAFMQGVVDAVTGWLGAKVGDWLRTTAVNADINELTTSIRWTTTKSFELAKRFLLPERWDEQADLTERHALSQLPVEVLGDLRAGIDDAVKTDRDLPPAREREVTRAYGDLRKLLDEMIRDRAARERDKPPNE